MADQGLSKEILKVLKSIDEKLTDGRKSEASKDTEEAQKPKKTFVKWWQITHRNLDSIAKIPLPESRPGSPEPREKSPSDDTETEGGNDIDSYRTLNEMSSGGIIQRCGFWCGFSCFPYVPYYSIEAKKLEDIKEELRSRLGHAWDIPPDGRIGLTFTLSAAVKRYELLRGRGNQDVTWLLGTANPMYDFQRLLAERRCCYFTVRDYDPWNRCWESYNIHEYQIRDRTIHPETKYPLLWPNDEAFHPVLMTRLNKAPLHQKPRGAPPAGRCIAPWRRLIYIQGLACIARSDVDDRELQLCPHLKPFDTRIPINLHVLFETGLTGRGDRTPDPWEEDCFHITFFEAMPMVPEHVQSSGRVGKLFGDIDSHQPSRYLRHSSYTVFMVSSHSDGFVDQNGPELPQKLKISGNHRYLFEPFYTILILTPDRHSRLNPELANAELLLKQHTAIHAQLQAIVYGLDSVLNKWRCLHDIFDNALNDDFMAPQRYRDFLFDDENFTRSRKLSWIRGCISEAETIISENIEQWNMYYARIRLMLNEPEVLKDFFEAALLHPTDERAPERIYLQFADLASKGCNANDKLVLVRTDFQKLSSKIHALRDEMSLASALVEGREAIRSTSNIKLLTYVSIIYLPLGFCAALWAVPNIQNGSANTPLIVITVLVGVLTYAIVFNLNPITNKIRASYQPKRQEMIDKMKEETGWWSVHGEKFEEFKPPDHRQVPTEWLIPLYLIWSTGNSLRKAITGKIPSFKNPILESPNGAELPRDQPADSQGAPQRTTETVPETRNSNTGHGAIAETIGGMKTNHLGSKLFSRFNGRRKKTTDEAMV